MSNPKYTPEQKAEFGERLAKLERKGIPALYATSISEELGITKDIVNNVRNRKTINFQVLEALERFCNANKTKKEAAK